MKNTGIVKKIDTLGRIVIPKELRKVLDIEILDDLEIFTEDNEIIILQKYTPKMACAITGEISSENKKMGESNLILSPEGIKILKNEITGLKNK